MAMPLEPARTRRTVGVATGMSPGLTALFTVAAALAVANIYYAQPLLPAIARDFGVGSGAASSLVTVTTAGYAVGLVLVVPLADIRDRRQLIVTLLAVVSVMQGLAAVAPRFGLLVVLSAVLSVSAVVAPIMVAFAATLARPDQRGRVTGTVMSGVLIGVLLARTGGGLVGDLAGSWRAVHVVAAVLMVLLTAVMHWTLPDVPISERLGYAALLRSVVGIVRAEPLLRLRCGYGFLCFAGFNVFWASSAFLLGSSPYHFTESLIGAFGLLGVAGAVAARTTGRFVDRGREHLTTGVLLVVLLASWGAMALGGGHWLAALVVGAFALDLAVQGVHVANLSTIYQLRPEARSRVTMAYTSTYFIGGAGGSAASGAAYALGGWAGVCLVGGGAAAVALGIWSWRALSARRS